MNAQPSRRFPLILASLLLAASFARADYPGNANFRNVATTSTATTRTDWVTNVLNNALSYSFDWSTGSPLCPGVTLVPTVLTTEAGWPRQMVCYCVRVDLTTPGLRFTGTDRCPEGWGDPMPESNSTCAQYESGHYPKRTVREKTSDFLARNRGSKSLGGKERNAVLAWNGAAWLPWQGANTNLWACPYSPLYSDGIQISNNRTGVVEVPNLTDPAPQIIFAQLKNGVFGMIPTMTEDIAKQTWFCVPAFVTSLVDGKWNDLDNGDVAQRTAIGISQDGKTFYILVCDGRRDGWTAGCDFTSLSKILFGMGAWVGFNLDGGGSSTLCRWNTSTGKPEVINRQSSLRDNGSNIAIYYMEPVAMLGSYFYEDFDFLMQDIIDGETDGSAEINVLRDATFTAEHPCIPSGRYNLWSTNNASIGWADGVTPQVAAGTIVRFRDIRFREGSRALSVAAGATAVFYDGVDLDEIDTQNAGGLVLAGVPACPVRVSCATVTGRNQTFATSTLSLAAATAAATNLVSDLGDGYVAVASGSDGNVTLSWDKPVSFGPVSGSMADLSRATFSVTVAESASGALPAGALLRVTVTSEDGRRSAAQSVAFNGPGTYRFNTAQSSNPSLCTSGYGYDYLVEVTDANGVRIPHTETVRGTMSIGYDKPWFAATAADDSATGGFWTAKPALDGGEFRIKEEDDDAIFAADEPRTGRVRLTTVATFPGTLAASGYAAVLDEIAAKETLPHGAVLLAEGASDDEPIWRGLVREGGALSFRALRGPAAIGIPVSIVQEVDWSSGAPLVSYLVATNGTDFVRLSDDQGQTWFDSASSSSAASGRVEIRGTGRVSSLVGTSRRRVLPGTLIRVR